MKSDPTPSSPTAGGEAERIAERMVFADNLGIHVQDEPTPLPGGGSYGRCSVQMFPPRGNKNADVVRHLRGIISRAIEGALARAAAPPAPRVPAPFEKVDSRWWIHEQLFDALAEIEQGLSRLDLVSASEGRIAVETSDGKRFFVDVTEEVPVPAPRVPAPSGETPDAERARRLDAVVAAAGMWADAYEHAVGGHARRLTFNVAEDALLGAVDAYRSLPPATPEET